MSKTQTKQICIYLQIHQPYRINPSQITESKDWKELFHGLNSGKHGQNMTNKAIFEKVCLSCYIPTTKFWLQQFQKHQNLKLTLSFSGTFLEQCLEFPEYGKIVLNLFRKLLATGRVEILDETYYHSLTFMVSVEEYLRQIQMHRDIIKQLFDYTPTNFRNTELIYNNTIGTIIQNLGYQSILIEDAPWMNMQTKADLIFKNKVESISVAEQNLFDEFKISQPCSNLILLPRDSNASDGMIFGQSDRLVKNIIQDGRDLTCIFTDYEFLGEHNLGQKEEAYTNLSNQLDYLVEAGYNFTNPQELVQKTKLDLLQEYDSTEYSSWAHTEKDISVWVGGTEQNKAFDQLNKLYQQIQKYPDKKLLEAWRRISTSCHFYFLGRKTGTDGDFVSLFSPFESVDSALENYLEVAYTMEKILENNA